MSNKRSSCLFHHCSHSQIILKFALLQERKARPNQPLHDCLPKDFFFSTPLVSLEAQQNENRHAIARILSNTRVQGLDQGIVSGGSEQDKTKDEEKSIKANDSWNDSSVRCSRT